MNITAGQDVTIRTTLTDQDGVPLPDLDTSLEIIWGLARAYSVDPDITKKLTAAEISVFDIPNGIIDVTLVPADTEGIQGDFVHQAEVKNVSGAILPARLGALTIDEDMLENVT